MIHNLNNLTVELRKRKKIVQDLLAQEFIEINFFDKKKNIKLNKNSFNRFNELFIIFLHQENFLTRNIFLSQCNKSKTKLVIVDSCLE